MSCCGNCGANNVDGAYVCTNCGAALNQGVPNQVTDPGKGFAIASLICSLVSLVCCGGILAILGLVFGIMAKSKGSKSGMATAGIIISVITFVVGIIVVVASIVSSYSIVDYMRYYY